MTIESNQIAEVTANSRAIEFIERILLNLVDASESDTARIQAAKILLERLSENRDGEISAHEKAERDNALAEARCLLDEVAETLVARNLCVQCATAVVDIGAAGTNNAGADDYQQPEP